MSGLDAAPRTRAEMLEAGRALRSRVSRRSHAEWAPPLDRPEPLEILARSNANRHPLLARDAGFLWIPAAMLYS
jgi:hypothetical protein